MRELSVPDPAPSGLTERLRAQLTVEDVGSAVDAVLAALAPQLTQGERHVLMEHVPARHVPALVPSEGVVVPRVPSAEDVTFEIARRLGINTSRAAEVASVVCQAIAHECGPGRAELERRMPESIRPWFQGVPSGSSPGATWHPVGARPGTLASGKPGARHPLAEARPIDGQVGSILVEENPHGDRKLSSGALEAQADGRTLAGGRAGARRRLADSD